jgi:hypothetical protein
MLFSEETHLCTIGLLNSGFGRVFFIWASFGSRSNNQLFPEKLTIPNPCNIISYACSGISRLLCYLSANTLPDLLQPFLHSLCSFLYAMSIFCTTSFIRDVMDHIASLR